MNRIKIDLTDERKIITYMIVSKRFLSEIVPILRIKHFKASYCKIVCKWILEYWNEYKEAPLKNIQEIYIQKRNTIREEKDLSLIAKFLRLLSEEWKKSSEIQNMDYSIANAIKYLKLRSLEILNDNLEESVDIGDPLHGEQAIANYSKITIASGDGIYVEHEKSNNKMISAFEDIEEEILFRFSGDLGKVVGGFARGDLVSFLGTTGRGKTWWQLYTAMLAMDSGYNAVFFSLEMTERQMARRMWQNFVGQPREDTEIKLPHFVKSEEEKSMYRIEHKVENRKGVDPSEIIDIKDRHRMYSTADMHLKTFPAYSADIDDIKAYLDVLEYYDNFIPDVVVVDSADNLMSKIKGDYRHKIDDVWRCLRGLAQERNILIVSASHAGRRTLDRDTKESDITEDIRKLHHVSKMIILNQNREEYEEGIMRIKSGKERDGQRSFKEVAVLQCLSIGRPYLDSRFFESIRNN